MVKNWLDERLHGQSPNRESFKNAKANAHRGNKYDIINASKKKIKEQHGKQSREEFNASETAVQNKMRELTAKFRASFSPEDEKNLRDFCQENNMRLEIFRNHRRDERCEIARMAFDGLVEDAYHGYSSEFEKVMAYPFNYTEVPAEQYNLDDSSIWQIMKQFKEFAKIEDRIKEGLSKARYPADKLKDKNINDFRHLLHTYCDARYDTVQKRYDRRPFHKLFPQTDENGEVMHDSKGRVITTGGKKQFIMNFINEHPEFADKMMKVPGARQDYVDELVNQMKRGNTDMTYFLQDHPEWKDQMAINIHHVINIKDIRLLEHQEREIGEINSKSNLCVMGCGTIQQVIEQKNTKAPKTQELEGAHGSMHNSDTVFKIAGNNDSDKTRIAHVAVRVMPPEGAVCMLSYNSDFIIIDEELKQRETERPSIQTSVRPQKPEEILNVAVIGNNQYNGG